MKSFLVSFEFEYACVAPDEDAARDFLEQAFDDACPLLQGDCHVTPLENTPIGWKPTDFVYGNLDDGKDMTLEDAMKMQA